MAPSKLIGRFVYWILILLVIITASDTLGWNAVSEEVSNLLAFFFNRRTFQVGMTIEVNDVKGKIIDINNISAIVQNEQEEKIVIPANELLTNKVKIIG